MEICLEWGATRFCTRAYFILVYINDLEEGVGLTGKIFKFADDTKLGIPNKYAMAKLFCSEVPLSSG